MIGPSITRETQSNDFSGRSMLWILYIQKHNFNWIFCKTVTIFKTKQCFTPLLKNIKLFHTSFSREGGQYSCVISIGYFEYADGVSFYVVWKRDGFRRTLLHYISHLFSSYQITGKMLHVSPSQFPSVSLAFKLTYWTCRVYHFCTISSKGTSRSSITETESPGLKGIKVLQESLSDLH